MQISYAITGKCATKKSAPPVYFAAEFQVVAVVLMLKVSRRSKKGQMKLQVDPPKTYCINAGSFAAEGEITFALSVATSVLGGGGQFLSET